MSQHAKCTFAMRFLSHWPLHVDMHTAARWFLLHQRLGEHQRHLHCACRSGALATPGGARAASYTCFRRLCCNRAIIQLTQVTFKSHNSSNDVTVYKLLAKRDVLTAYVVAALHVSSSVISCACSHINSFHRNGRCQARAFARAGRSSGRAGGSSQRPGSCGHDSA